MDIPFRRIVGLIAIGLVVGALLRLTPRILRKIRGKTNALRLRGGVLATFDVDDQPPNHPGPLRAAARYEHSQHP
jgi:hypothetical protein